jgi:hypothetical protein
MRINSISNQAAFQAKFIYDGKPVMTQYGEEGEILSKEQIEALKKYGQYA